MTANASMWARAQKVGNASAKAVLREYAHWASEDYSTWVSKPTLIEALEMDIKTIRAARDRLIEMGFLVETKRRSGGTGNIVVYQMIAPPGTTVVQSHDRRTGVVESLSPPSLEEYQLKQDQKRSPSKSGTPKGNQKRSPSKNGAPPDSDARGTKNGFQGVPNFPEGVPKTDPDFSDLGFESSGVGNARDDDADQTNPPPNDERAKPDGQSPGFDRFWTAWPAASGRKQAREICLSHWIANGLEVDVHLIVAHVEAMKRTDHWKRGGDPTPIRYLEGRRWQDCSPEEIESAADDQRQTIDGAPWYEGSVEVIESHGALHGVRPRGKDEAIAMYRVLVAKAARDKAAIDFVLRDAKRFNAAQLFQFAVAEFGDALLPPDF